MIYIKNDRSVFPNNVKVSNQYENETRTINFDLSDVQFSGNTYLICKYQNNQDFYAPLLLDSDFSIPVETFLSAQAGTYSCVIAISTATIGQDYDFSTDNPLFVSNIFTLTVDANFLTGTSTAWQLTPAAQNYFDQLIALVDKVQSDLDSGAFVGNGIQSITKISTSGLVDTYQITFTNGSTFDYQVTNGKDGQTPTITIQNGYWYINGVNTGQQAQGEQGEPGKDGTDGTDGVGIQSIEKTSTSGNVDTYTITYTNETTSTFTVTNGVTPNITIGTVTTLQPTEQATASITGTVENPVLNLGIPQGMDGTPGVNENTLIGTVEKSENPSVTDSYNTELMNLMFYGQSTQESTTGANLLDRESLESISGTTNVVKSIPISLVPNTQYTFSDNYGLWNGDGLYMYITNTADELTDANKIAILVNSNLADRSTFTFQTDDSQNFYVTALTGNIMAILQKASEIQINTGSSALPYEPYTGEQPSPNPDYPQEITAIEQVNGVIMDSYQLFDASKLPTTSKESVTVTNNGDGSFTIAGSGSLSSSLNITYYDENTVKRLKPGKMTLYVGAITYPYAEIQLVDENNKLVVSVSCYNVKSREVIITKDQLSKTKYLRLIIFGGTLPVVSGTIKPMLYQDGDGTWEPFDENPQEVSFTPPQPLYSTPDGSIADVVNVESGQYEYNMSGAVVFDGSTDEAWKLYSPQQGFYINLNDMIKGVRLKGFCDKFQNVQSGNSKGIIFGLNDTRLYVMYVNEYATTVDEWRQWLSENPITVVYPVATPTTQPIPAETLAILRALKSNTGVTNVICNAPVSFDYEQSLQIVIRNIWNAIGQTNANILLNGGNN